MQSADDTIYSSDSAAHGYTDLETVRKRLIELEQNRIFSDEDLSMLLRQSAHTNLKDRMESRNTYRRSRATSERTAGGRAVIRSWAPSVIAEVGAESWCDDEEDTGWKQFTPSHTIASKPIVTPVTPARVEPAFIGRNLKRPSRLKRMQSRNFIVTILANIIFIPKQAVSSLVNMVVPASNRRAC
jgi:hypothetical protein